MQAIITKYLGPTNTRGGRFKAVCQAGSITVPHEYRGSVVEHTEAARALAEKLGWDGTFIGAALPDGKGYAFVFVDSFGVPFHVPSFNVGGA